QVSHIKLRPVSAEAGEVEAELGRVESLAAKSARPRPRGAERVVLGALLLVGENGISLARLFELGFVTALLVRMVGVREFSEGLFYLLLGSVPIYPENFVI